MGDNYGVTFRSSDGKVFMVAGGSDSVNLENMEPSTGHNEGYVSAMCNRDDWFNDQFNFSYLRSDNDSQFLVTHFNSEAHTALWYDGYISFYYSPDTKAWRMFGTVRDREWAFCDAKASLDNVLDALRCFSVDTMLGHANSETGYDVAREVGNLADSLERGAANILNTALAYTERDDCTQTLSQQQPPAPMAL